MAQEEPSVEELKRLLRRLEKLEPVEAPRADGLASLRSPLPPSEQFGIPSPLPPHDPIPGPVSTPLVLAPDVARPASLRTEPPVALVAVPADRAPPSAPKEVVPEVRGGGPGLRVGLAALALVCGVTAYMVLSAPPAQNVAQPRQTSDAPARSVPPATPVEAPPAALAAAPVPVEAQPARAEASPALAAPVGSASGGGAETAVSPVETTVPPVAVVEAPAPPFATVGALTAVAPTILVETPVRAPAPAPAAEAPASSVPLPPSTPVPTGPRLVTAADWSIGAGRRVAVPLVIDPPSAVADHYVLIEGLEPDAFVSRGIEVLGGTWMVRGTDLEIAEIERAASAPPRATLNLELRHVDGSIVGRQSVGLAASTQGQRATAAQPAASEPQRAAAETNSGSDAQRLLRRGQLMLDSGNLSGARLLWERAAEQGSSEAALALGRSYDPAQVPLPGVAGSVADRALARRWYERAAALGSSEARERARTLD